MPLEKFHTSNSLRPNAGGTIHRNDPVLNLPLSLQLRTLIIRKLKFVNVKMSHSLLILCTRWRIHLCAHLLEIQLNVHIFLLRSKSFPGTTYHIQICHVEALGSLPILNLLDKFVFCALFVCVCIWFILSGRVLVKSFQSLCFTESMLVFGINSVLIAGDTNYEHFKASTFPVVWGQHYRWS